MSRLVIWCLVALLSTASARADDSLWNHFQTPPVAARPTMRWWWNGNAVTTKEIVRELEILHRAGIGSVEICPTAMPRGANASQSKRLKWLSPDWCEMLKVASEAARERGMSVDLVVACGRPWGGDFVPPEHAAQKVELVTRRVKGPIELKLAREAFLALPPTPEGRAPTEEQAPELLFLRLVPEGCTKPEEVIDLVNAFDADGKLSAIVGEGEFVLCAGVLRKGFVSAQHNADGPGQPMLDHYNRDAVRAYLNHVSNSVRSNLGDDLGKFVETLVCDDANLLGANWTGDFAEEFKRRCGYELSPYLPFVVDFKQRLPVAKTFAPTLERVRNDYAKTIAELFRDRFVDTFTEWCREQGAKSRIETGNRGWLVGAAEVHMAPDSPQSSSHLFVNPATHGFPTWNKYASSAGHLADRRVISSKAMVNSRGVFQENLSQIKAAGDLNFLLGTSHTVLHGFNYSPPEAGFPGWVRSGTYFSSNNPWWPYLPQWVQYHSRLSSVFQDSRPVVQVAILAPTADVWGKSGLSAKAFHQTPWYVHQLWRSLSQHGCSADYVSQKVLQRAKCQDGKLSCGKMEYDALLIVDAQSLAPATTSALVLYADGGGKLAFVGRKPDRAAGLNNPEQRDQAVVQAMQHLAESKSAMFFEIAAPAKPEQLFDWTNELLNKLELPRSVVFDPPSRDLHQVHYRHDDRDIFFLANTSGQHEVASTASFGARGPHAWRWDPETGQRAVYPTTDKQARIVLGPHESLLLVFEPKEPPANAPRVAAPVESWRKLFTVAEPWAAEFVPIAGQEFSLSKLSPTDLSKSDDERLRNFAGTVVYRTRFELFEVPAGNVAIDLGTVHDIAEVQLNGEPLGAVWYGAPRFDATRRLHAGANTLEVRVATPLYNYTQSLEDNPTAMYWKKRASNKELVPAGLIGPVRLVTPLAHEEQPTANER